MGASVTKEQENLNTAASRLLTQVWASVASCAKNLLSGQNNWWPNSQTAKISHVHNTVCTKTDWPTQLVAQKYQRQDELFPSSFVFC